MKNTTFTIEKNIPLTDSVFLLVLKGDCSDIAGSGGFVNLRIEGYFLRRPLSLCDYTKDSLTLVYKVVGKGTEALSRLSKGTKLQVLTGLGKGYDLSLAGTAPLLIGGGAGVPPLYHLAKELRAQGKPVQVILGFNTKEEVFFEKEFLELGAQVTVTTVDGTYGTKGFVTDALPDDYSFFYACGPLPMLKAVKEKTHTSGQFSLEERMGCGFGACMGCSIKTTKGYARVCKEGPVFMKEEVLWEK